VQLRKEDPILNLGDMDSSQSYVYSIQKIANQIMSKWALGLEPLLCEGD
jgi:hypothetical protein